MKLFEKILPLVAAMLCCGSLLHAQDGAYSSFTPYSVFGVGDISKEGTAFNKSMGGIGTATRTNRYVSVINPASVTERDTLSFMADFTLAQSNKLMQQGSQKTANNTFNLYDFIISFPVWKSTAMYVGINPYSDVGYKFSTPVEDPLLIGRVGDVNYGSSGNGSLYKLYLGGAAEFWKKLSVGAEADYYFGNLQKSTSLVFSNSSYRSMSGGYDLNLHGFSGKFGIQWDQNLSKGTYMTIGATYKLKTNLRGRVSDYQFASIGSVTDTLRSTVDTLANNPGRVSLASEIGVGVSIRSGDKWMFELDYLRSDWRNSGMDKVNGFSNVGTAVFSTNTSQSVRAGFTYTPSRNDIRYYYRRISYRGGIYFDTAYYQLDGNTVGSAGLTLGVSLPVDRRMNYITLGMDLGQRGILKDQMIRERYINFTIGFNIYDIWFVKPRYE